MGLKILLEIIENNNNAADFSYICTNTNDHTYLQEFSNFSINGGNSKVQIIEPTYTFFKENPEAKFEAFEKYFDENLQEYFKSESENSKYIGITTIGKIEKFYLYTPKRSPSKLVNLKIE